MGNEERIPEMLGQLTTDVAVIRTDVTGPRTDARQKIDDLYTFTKENTFDVTRLKAAAR